METVQVTTISTLLSPINFLLLAIKKEWLRLALFLPLAAAPTSFLVYVMMQKVGHGYDEAYYFVDSLILSVILSPLGFFMMVKAEPKTRAFFISILGTVAASVPLDMILFKTIGEVIRKLVAD